MQLFFKRLDSLGFNNGQVSDPIKVSRYLIMECMSFCFNRQTLVSILYDTQCGSSYNLKTHFVTYITTTIPSISHPYQRSMVGSGEGGM